MTENPQDMFAKGEPPPRSGQPGPLPPPPPPGQAQGYGQAPSPGQAPGYGQAPPPGQAPAYGQPTQGGLVSPSDARMWSLLAHLGGIFFSFVPALVVYLIYKERDAFIRRHASQALNFQIILAIAYFVSSLLTVILIGIPMLFAAAIAALVFSILGAVAANRGDQYTYPLTPTMFS